MKKLTPGFKNHMRNFDNFRQAVESPMDYFCPKNFIPSTKSYRRFI